MQRRTAEPLRDAWCASVRWLANHRLLGIPAQLARVARSFVRNYDVRADPYDLHTNGERAVIDRVVRPESVVFDVGANVGDWSALAAARGAKVHSFEISPDTARTLAHRFAHDTRVSTHAVGLSDRDGEIRLRHYPDMPVLSTTIADYPHPYRSKELVAPVVAGARFAHELGVDHIDLLKIDVEGAEPAVLKGFMPMLESAAIDIIQYEYGLANTIEKFLVCDFYDLLGRLGYRLGPLTPDGVVFQNYHPRLERFEHVNWVAVQRDRGELIALLSARLR